VLTSEKLYSSQQKHSELYVSLEKLTHKATTRVRTILELEYCLIFASIGQYSVLANTFIAWEPQYQYHSDSCGCRIIFVNRRLKVIASNYVACRLGLKSELLLLRNGSKCLNGQSAFPWFLLKSLTFEDDDEGRINFSVALSPKTTRTHNNKPEQWSHVIVVSAMRRC